MVEVGPLRIFALNYQTIVLNGLVELKTNKNEIWVKNWWRVIPTEIQFLKCSINRTSVAPEDQPNKSRFIEKL